MSQENSSTQPLIRYVNRQQMSWRAVDVERLIEEEHLARHLGVDWPAGLIVVLRGH